MSLMPQIKTGDLPERQSNLNPVQWNQALGMARKLCSDIFQEGGSPKDAVQTFGPSEMGDDIQHWGHAINAIAFSIYAPRYTSLH